MSQSAREAYLATQVMTATPQKLHLLLIEGALRSLHQVEAAWQAGREEEACEALIRGQEIVSEMLGSVSTSDQPISRRLASLYLFLFRTLSEAQIERNSAKLADVLRILEVERQTWVEVCAKFGAQVDPQAAPARPQTPPAPAPKAPPLHLPPQVASGGISFQA